MVAEPLTAPRSTGAEPSPNVTRTFWIVALLPAAGAALIVNVAGLPATTLALGVNETLGAPGAATTTCVDAVAVAPLLSVAVADTENVPAEA